MKRLIKKILNEEKGIKGNIYDKISSTITDPPFVFTITEVLGFDEHEILPIMEKIFGMELKQYGGDGADYYFHPKNGGWFVYYESWDSSDWVYRIFNPDGSLYKTIDPDGEMIHVDIDINN